MTRASTRNERPGDPVAALARLAHSLARPEVDAAALLRRGCDVLVAPPFPWRRCALFRNATERGTVPAAICGWDEVEVLHGRLPPLEEWPLFRRALAEGGAAHAGDAQVDGDVPLEVAGALSLRAVAGTPLWAGDECLGFALVDRGGAPFAPAEDELLLLEAAGATIAAALAPALAHDDSRRTGELKSQFIALASHELRAPVAAIHGITVTLRERADDLRPEQAGILQSMLYEQSDRLRRLIDQLLDLTRLEANAVPMRPERFPVRERVDGLLRELVPDRLDEVKVEVDEDVSAYADPDGFDRIVANLITNAFRYGSPPVTIAAYQLDTHFRLFVEDRGTGVEPEFAPRLFERFARARPSATDSGSGLGLAIAQSFAQAQGGRLLYEDATPSGARFQLVLPVRDRG